MEQLKGIVVLLLCVIFFSCVGNQEYLPDIPKFDPELTKEVKQYEPQVSKLEKPGRPEKILLDKDFKPTEDVKQAKYVAYETKEYAKIVAHFKREKALEEIANELEELVQQNIITINGMQKILAMEREMRRMERELTNYQIELNNQMQKEYYICKTENFLLKTFIVAGTIVLVALSL